MDRDSRTTAPENGSRGPLAGLRVLDLGTVYAAPLAAMLLGDYGAEVVKVEHPSGDPARSHGYLKNGTGLWWKVIARNKETVTLNLSRPAAKEILLEMVEEADVLIENFRPGVLEGWGLGPETLHERNPGLVILRVTGFGQRGPYAKRRAFGTLAEAMSGFAHMTGEPGGPPTLPPFGLADGVAALAGTAAIAFALYHRDAAGGSGQTIDLSLLEPLMTLLGPGPSAYQQFGITPGRQGNRSPNNAPRNAYRTRDGHWVVVSASATSVARRVMTLVGREDLTREPWFDSAGERVLHADELDSAVEEWIAAHDRDEAIRVFEEVGAALAPVYSIADIVADPQIEALEALTTVADDDCGELLMQNVMFRMSATPGSIRFAGRDLGEDTEAVMERLAGLDRAAVEELREEGVL
ncbi:MAG TPA: CoA transferase [Solirubrobacterales bacterium]|jgi:crotonobetainyl-CoA:carnitine CoA-transferase CaiB-like acyl-CoA transferase